MNLNGPWKVVGNRADDVFFHVVDRDYTCFVGTSNKYRANAIAKVPEMVEALKSINLKLQGIGAFLPMPYDYKGIKNITSDIYDEREKITKLLAEMEGES